MFNVNNYLEKFKELSFSRDFLRNSVVEAVREVCKIEIDPKKVTVKNFIARISERPIIKSEIYLNKEKILVVLDKKVNGKIKEIY